MHHDKNNHTPRQIGSHITIAATSFLLTTHAYAAAGGVTPGATIIDQVITWASALGLAYMTLMIMWTGYKCTSGGARIQDYGNLLLGAIMIGSAAAIALLFF